MRKRLELDEAQVRRLYAAGATAAEIGAQMGCSPQTVTRRLDAAGITRRRSGHRCAEFSDEDIRRAYVDRGIPAPMIARELGIGATTVYRSLARQGIDSRDSKALSSPAELQWLDHAYNVERLPLATIAAELGCSKPCIYRTLRRMGMQPRTSATMAVLCAVTTDWLREQYVAKQLSTYEIAAELNCDPKTVWRMLRDRGIETRSRSEVMRVTGAMQFWGANNPNYRDGSSNERDLEEIRFRWDELRLSVYSRDGFLCVRCGARSEGPGTLHAHHVRPWVGSPELRFAATNLVTLCRACHRWVHSSANAEREYLSG